MLGGYLSLRDSGGQLNSDGDLFRRLDGIRLLVKHFFRPNQDKELLDNDALSELFRTPRSLRTPRSKRTQSPASLPSSKKSKRSSKTRQKRDDPDAEYLPKEEGRDKDERDKCFERDGKGTYKIVATCTALSLKSARKGLVRISASSLIAKSRRISASSTGNKVLGSSNGGFAFRDFLIRLSLSPGFRLIVAVEER